MSLSRKCSGTGIRGCSKFIANWDEHLLCRECRDCSRESTCEVCRNWSGAIWSKHQKAMDRARVRKATKSRSLSVEDSRVPGHMAVADSSARPGDSVDLVAAQVFEPGSRGPSASRGVRSPSRVSTPRRALSPHRKRNGQSISPPCTSGTSSSSGSASGGSSLLGREVAHEVLVGVRWLGIDRVATAAMVVVPVLMNATGTTGLVIDLDMALRTIRRIATGTVRIVPETVIGLVAGLGLVTREHSCLPYPRHPSLGF